MEVIEAVGFAMFLTQSQKTDSSNAQEETDQEGTSDQIAGLAAEKRCARRSRQLFQQPSPFQSSTGLHFVESPTRRASLGLRATFSGWRSIGLTGNGFEMGDPKA